MSYLGCVKRTTGGFWYVVGEVSCAQAASAAQRRIGRTLRNYETGAVRATRLVVARTLRRMNMSEQVSSAGRRIQAEFLGHAVQVWGEDGQKSEPVPLCRPKVNF